MIRQHDFRSWIRGLSELLILLSLASELNIVPALAHGGAVLSVTPTIAAPGDTITVSADGVEAGEVFTISLEGVSYKTTLGTVTAEGDGFEQEFNLPDDVPPGNFQVRATSADGEQISAELTVSPEEEAQTVPEPSSEKMSLDRGRSPVQLDIVVFGLLLSGAIGLILIRKRE